MTLVAFAALSLSVNAQEGPRIWQGGPGKKYIDRATLDRRAKNYHFVINDQSSDVYLAKYKGKKCWFGGATGRDNMGYYDEGITRSEEKILREKREKEQKKNKKK